MPCPCKGGILDIFHSKRIQYKLWNKNQLKQTGAELGKAQIKLELGVTRMKIWIEVETQACKQEYGSALWLRVLLTPSPIPLWFSCLCLKSRFDLIWFDLISVQSKSECGTTQLSLSLFVFFPDAADMLPLSSSST